MRSKLIAACMALAAFAAFAAMPAAASANPVLTHPTGTVLATGTKIKGHSIGETKMTTPLGNVTCSTATLTGTLTTNDTTKGVEGEVTAAAFSGTGSQAAGEPTTECTSTWTGPVSVTPNPSTNGLPWCLEATTNTDEGKIRGGSCSSLARPIRFVMVFTSIGTCVYQRSSAAIGTITTEPEDAVVHLEKQEWTKFEGGALCPSNGTLDMSFTLQTDVENVEPLYFSS